MPYVHNFIIAQNFSVKNTLLLKLDEFKRFFVFYLDTANDTEENRISSVNLGEIKNERSMKHLM